MAAASTAASASGVSAAMNSTSVRGSMTSLSWRLPAANTSAITSRSSWVSSLWPTTMSRSSSVVMAARSADGLPPTSRTMPLVDFDSTQITGRDSVAIRSSSGAVRSDRLSARWRPSRLGASSPSTSVTYEMANVTVTNAAGAAASGRMPHPSRTGANSGPSASAPRAADSTVATVTPTWMADRKRLGSRASFCTRAPRRPSRLRRRIWLSRRETIAISAAAKNPPIRMNMRTRAMVTATLLTSVVRSGVRHASRSPRSPRLAEIAVLEAFNPLLRASA